MADFRRKWTDEQREAVATAHLERRLSSVRVAQLAAAGDLTRRDGTKLDPFPIPPSSIATIARRTQEKQAKHTESDLARIPHRDAIEQLRIAYITTAERELQAEQRKKDGTRNLERMRQIGRVLREAVALPARTEPVPTAPGAKENGKTNGGKTGGGLALAIQRDLNQAPDHLQDEGPDRSRTTQSEAAGGREQGGGEA